LIAAFAAGVIARHRELRQYAANQARHTAGTHNAEFLQQVLHQAASSHLGWVALVVGIVVFLLAAVGSALQIQRMLAVIWDRSSARKGPSTRAKNAAGRAPAFIAIFALALFLAVLLFAGAAIHSLMTRMHGLSFGGGLLYQALDVGLSIVLLTLVFLCIFAYLPPADVPWSEVWIAAFVSAILYERGQFALSFYFGQMDAKSPYADAGALVAVLAWLFYSAQVLLVGAGLTKVLTEMARER
jgi:membrane protein